VQVFGLMMVRNEADILRVNLLHHLTLGIDQFLIIDNGSTDGTPEILEELSRDTQRVHWTRDMGPFQESRFRSALSREAYHRGADWVLPTDADEFWFAPRENFRDVFEASSAGVLRAHIVNFVQRRDQLIASAEGLLHMTRRAAIPMGSVEHADELVESGQLAQVEIKTLPKCVCRASATAEIGLGSHAVAGVTGSQENTDDLVCFHAGLRARSVLEAKMTDHAERAKALGSDPHLAWHWRRWGRLWHERRMDDEWRANSYEDNHLDVHGVLHPLVFDPRLRNLVAPWVEPARENKSDANTTYSVTMRPGVESGSREPEVRTDPRTECETPALLLAIHDQFTADLNEARRARQIYQAELSERDTVILGLQAELQEKVGEANQVVAGLQAELHEKVGEANRVIAELQAEQQMKIDEREQSIHDLQAELCENVGAANRVIAELQAEMHGKVSEANVVIRDLQAQLAATREALAQAVQAGETPDARAAQLSSDMLAERDRVIRELEAQLAALRRSGAWPLVGAYDGLRKRLRADVRRFLSRASGGR
jgi:glycosyltransferase involved in cell wall biosynthesis